MIGIIELAEVQFESTYANDVDIAPESHPVIKKLACGARLN